MQYLSWFLIENHLGKNQVDKTVIRYKQIIEKCNNIYLNDFINFRKRNSQSIRVNQSKGKIIYTSSQLQYFYKYFQRPGAGAQSRSHVFP